MGRLRHRIRFMKPLVGRGDHGQEVRTWITSGEVWADIDHRLTGTIEREVASRLQDFQSAVITIRYAATVYPQMRIIANNREWNIRGVMPDAKHEYMQIEAIIDSPRQQTWVTPEGMEWHDEQGQPWVFAKAGDVKVEADEETTWTDSAGIEYSGPNDANYQNEDGNLLVSHPAGDNVTKASGLDEWTDGSGLTWNPA